MSVLAAAAVLAGLRAPAAVAAERPWLALRTERFGVVSQLDEKRTREWAVEFDQFVDALHQLFSVKDVDLPPLTIVLFADSRAFAPYRYRTQSGQADVAGFFRNMDTWSTIGMAGSGSSPETRRTIYHEAVHWFASADPVASPLWFEEGLAEVFSTFQVKGGKGRWGLPIDNSVAYLQRVGVQPLDQFLRISQDEALHGSQTYYPEAWAFTHYLMFGNGGTERSQLGEFLRLQRETDLDTAFTTAFGASYAEITSALQRYLKNGRYGIAEVPVRDRSAEMVIEKATTAQVEFALARLATAGNNDDLAREHIERVLTVAPKAAEPYDLLAALASRANDHDALTAALDVAIERGSKDAKVYSLRGFQLVNENRQEGSPVDGLLPTEVARRAADTFERSLRLRPRSREVYEGLMFALLNVKATSPADDAALAAGRRTFPTDGVVLICQAAVEKQRGNVPEAARLLRAARTDPFTVPARYRPMLSPLHDSWLIGWLGPQVQSLAQEGKFEAARALINEQLADDGLTERARTLIERIAADLSGNQRLLTIMKIGNRGNGAEARAMLRDLAGDPTVSERTRRDAERMLEQLSRRATR